MATISSNRLMAALEGGTIEPVSGQRAVLEVMEEIVNGDELLVDASNPAAFLLGVAVTASSNAIIKNQVLSRRQYPELALTSEDLYLWTPDRDLINRWWRPSLAKEIEINLSMGEIRKAAVATGVGTVRKLTIPQNTEFMVGAYTFTLEYPIDIRILSNGNPTVSFGNIEFEPAIPIETNMIDWDVVDFDGVEWLTIRIPIYEFKISNNVAHLNTAQVYNESFGFQDNFFFARVFTRSGTNGWQEIRTTYTEHSFDPGRVTAMLQLNEGSLNVKIPQVYYTYGLMRGEIKVAIYTTKGVNNQYLGEYFDTDWSYRWSDVLRDDLDTYAAAMNALATIKVFSASTLSGAREPLSFVEFRKRVMESNVGDVQIPITRKNLTREVSDVGFGATTDLDDLTQRVIWATQELPLSNDDDTIAAGTVAPPSTVMSSYIATLEQLVKLPGVSDNGSRVTMHPSVLFKMESGAPQIVSQGELDALHALQLDGQARAISSAGYIYTPFYYVFDTSNNRFAARVYHLDEPEIKARRYVRENDTLALELNAAGAITVVRTKRGYKINLVTKSGESFQNLDNDQHHIQLAFVPYGETARAYLNGTLIGRSDKELVWEFELLTNFDIDENDSLYFTNFQMFSGQTRPHGAPLTSTFDILYVVSDYTIRGMKKSTIDDITNSSMLPVGSYGVVWEQVKINLGDALTYLWRGSRPIPTPMDYQTYAADTPDVYAMDEYARENDDPNGPIIFDRVDGVLTPRVKHKAGEIKKNPDGSVKYKGLAGQMVIDPLTDAPVPKGPRGLAWQIDMFFIDGRYYFVNDPDVLTYMKYVVRTIKDRVVDELGTLNGKALEETKLYYRPKNTLGDIRVIVEEGREIFLPAEQYLRAVIMLSKEDHKNQKLTDGMRTTIGISMAKCLAMESTSTDAIESDIKTSSGVATLGIGVSGIGGDKNYLTVTTQSNDGKLSLRKKVVPTEEGLLTIEDDIDITFKRHLPSADAV